MKEFLQLVDEVFWEHTVQAQCKHCGHTCSCLTYEGMLFDLCCLCVFGITLEQKKDAFAVPMTCESLYKEVGP